MSDDLNGLDSRINIRSFFERILQEQKEISVERNKRLDERFESQEKAIKKAEERLDRILSGFPQEYARKTEMEQMRVDLASTAALLADKVVDSATVLATAQEKITERQDNRLTNLEKFQNKLLGIALGAPFLMALALWFLNHQE